MLSERGLGGNDVDLRHRLDGLRRDRSGRADEARRMAKRWAESAQAASSVAGARDDRGDEMPIGAILALAYPERLAKNRGGAAGAFLLANGRGANIDPASPLAREPYLAVAEIIGSAAQGRITLAAAIGLADIEAHFADRIEVREDVSVDSATLALRCRRSRRLGAITLGEQPMPVVPDETTAKRLAAAIAAVGLDRLPWTKALRQWRDRVAFLRGAEGDEWPDLSDAALAESAAQWLAPLLADKTALSALTAPELESALQNMLPYAMRRRLEAEAPTHFDAPSGSRVPIEYDADGPKLAIRVQELFGLDRHPDHRPRPRAAGDRTAVSRPPPGAGDARPPQFLARQLCRRAGGPAGPLPPPSLARGPAVRPRDPPRQAARAVIFAFPPRVRLFDSHIAATAHGTSPRVRGEVGLRSDPGEGASPRV